MKFIIGIIILIVLNVLSFFIPFSFVTDTVQGGIEGVGTFFDSSTGYVTLAQTGYGFGLASIILSIIVYILYLVLFLTKKINIIPLFIFYIVALITPLYAIFDAIRIIFSGGEMFGDSFAWYAESQTSGLTMFAYLYIIGCFVAIFFIALGLHVAKEKMDSEGSKGAVVSLKKETESTTKTTKTVVNKDPVPTDEDDFSF